MIKLNGKYNRDCMVFCDDVEHQAISLIQSILDKQVSEGVPVRIMPDVHAGKGITIGFTMPLTKLLSPALIGVDIGCGMQSTRFQGDKLDLVEIDKRIKNEIPMGFNIQDDIRFKTIPYGEVQEIANAFVKKFNEKFKTDYTAPTYNEKWLTQKLKDIKMDSKKFWNSIGSLGGGNHFIEIGVDETNMNWLTVHCGSRNFGLKIADYWTNVANGIVKNVPKEYNILRDKIIQTTMPKSDIPKKLDELKRSFEFGVDKEYLKDDNLIGYLFDMIFAQQYAVWNRTTITNQIIDIIGINKIEETIETTHNYVNFKDLIIRKGAISSYVGEKMIIPFNMRDGILLCEGKGNQEWNNSAPHGAGRIMSRSKAKVSVDLESFKKSMENVYSTSVCKSTLDESPFAYKNSKMIEDAIGPTATILRRIKPILNIKDTSTSKSWKERKIEKRNKLNKAQKWIKRNK